MEPDEVKKLIEAGLPECQVQASGDGSHFEVTIVGDVFADKRPVARQQLVYGALGESITSGAIHAITIKAYTPKEWETARKLQVS